MSGILNDRIVEQGTIRGHFSEVASRTRVDRLEGLPAKNARIITGQVPTTANGVCVRPWFLLASQKLQINHKSGCFLCAYTSDHPNCI